MRFIALHGDRDSTREDTRRHALYMKADGYSHREIATECGICMCHVHDILEGRQVSAEVGRRVRAASGKPKLQNSAMAISDCMLVKKMANARGMSARELSSRVGVSVAKAQKILRGTSRVSISTLQRRRLDDLLEAYFNAVPV